MPIELLIKPGFEHTMIHDLEAVYWVLVYVVLHFCKHDRKQLLLGSELFDSCEDKIEEDGTVALTGGDYKFNFLAKRQLVDFPFACAPLRTLMTALTNRWTRYHSMRMSAALGPEDQARFDEVLSVMRDPTWLLDELQAALDIPAGQWAKSDVVPDQFPPLTRSQKDRLVDNAAALMHNAQLGANGSTLDPKDFVRRQAPRTPLYTPAGNKRTLDSAQPDGELEQPPEAEGRCTKKPRRGRRTAEVTVRPRPPKGRGKKSGDVTKD